MILVWRAFFLLADIMMHLQVVLISEFELLSYIFSVNLVLFACIFNTQSQTSAEVPLCHRVTIFPSIVVFIAGTV